MNRVIETSVEPKKEWTRPQLRQIDIEKITSKLTTSNDGAGHANS
jgi:hypothetical protein